VFGLSRRLPQLRHALDEAQSYEQWRAIAGELDVLAGGAAWRADDESRFYDAESLRRSLTQLEALRRDGAPMPLADYLHDSLHRHLNEVTDPGLFATSFVGTKYLVERYLDSVCAALDHLCDADGPIPAAQRLALFEREAHAVGRSALMLSGGASLGLFHIGVIKALHAARLLPSIVSGASTGSMIAGGLCTRSEADLEKVLANPTEHVYTRVFRALAPSEMRDERAVMSQDQLLLAIKSNMAECTGRALCISVSPTRARQKPRLLCHLTAPDVLVTSASLASCAIPGLFPASTLLQRKGPKEHEYVPGERWIDGTIASDLPTDRLARLLNVNHTIVSQTNAHLIPFTDARSRSGLVPTVTDLLASSAYTQALQVLDVARRRANSPGLRRALEWTHGAAHQKFTGNITLHPPVTAWNYGIIFRNASQDALARLVRQGERATWPKLHVISAQTRVARTLEACVLRLRQRLRGAT
jgi:NTE family protein